MMDLLPFAKYHLRKNYSILPPIALLLACSGFIKSPKKYVHIIYLFLICIFLMGRIYQNKFVEGACVKSVLSQRKYTIDCNYSIGNVQFIPKKFSMKLL